MSSFVIADRDEKIEAVLMSEQISDDQCMITLLLNTGGPDNPFILTKAFMDKCLKNVEQETAVLFVAANESVDNFINGLFGTEKGPDRIQLKYAVYSLE